MLPHSPERLAWITLIVAQVICLLMTALSFGSGWWFFFDSSVDVQTTLEVGRNTVTLSSAASSNEDAVRISRALDSRDIVTTDQDSQGTLQFVDTSNDDLVIANVTVFANSQVQFIKASRPRFNFSDPHYEIKLSNVLGRLEIEIPTHLPNSLTLIAQGLQGEIILDQGGFYVLTSSTERTSIFARDGSARLRPYQGDLTHVPTGHVAEVDTSQSNIQLYVRTTELVSNARFISATEPGQPDKWACQLDGTPRPDYDVVGFEGRHAMYINRVAEGYSKASCFQFIGDPDVGSDVTQYRSLRIRATLEIIHQSLSICGVDASECPLMLALTYINENGDRQTWRHGFYAAEYPNVTVNRITCDTCLDNHDRITPGHWYTFESSNLFELPPGFIPTRLIQIEFYASGHGYEVAVGEVSLIAEN